MAENNLDYYLGLAYPVQIYSKPGGSGYAAEITDLPGCITFADTLGELWDMIEDAKRTWIETSLRAGLPIPEPASASPRPARPGRAREARPEGSAEPTLASSAEPAFSGDGASNGAITVHSLRSLYLKLLEQARGEGVDLSQFIRVALADTVGYRRTSG